MVAVEVLSAGWTAFFYILAVVAFVLAACAAPIPRVNLVAAGLALFVFVFAWNAVAAT